MYVKYERMRSLMAILGYLHFGDVYPYVVKTAIGAQFLLAQAK